MALFGKSIRDQKLKDIKKLVEAALVKAQEGYDRSSEARTGAYHYPARRGEGHGHISEADASYARAVHAKSTKELAKRLHEIAASLEK